MALLDAFLGEILRIETLRIRAPNVLPVVQRVDANDEGLAGRNAHSVDLDRGNVLAGDRRNHRPVALNFVQEHFGVAQLLQRGRGKIEARTVCRVEFIDLFEQSILDFGVERQEQAGVGRYQTARVDGL